MTHTLSLSRPAAVPVRSGRRWLVGLSLAAHGAGLGALLLLAMWRIDKLAIERGPLTMMVAPPRGGDLGGPKGAGTPPPKVDKVKPAPKVARDTVQPTPAVAHTPTLAVATLPEVGAGDGSAGTGDGGGGPGVGPATGTGCTIPPCGTDDGPGDGDPPERVVEKAPQLVAPKVVEGLRIAGDPQIHPPDPVRIAMSRDGKQRVTGTVKLCLDARGAVSSATVLASTGYPAYDGKLTSGVRTWRYRPYQIGGQAVPVCATVTFVYGMRR